VKKIILNLRPVVAIAIAASSLLILTGCAHNIDSGKSDAALAAIVAKAPAGYTASDTAGGDCGIDHCDPDKVVTLTSSADPNFTPAAACEELLSWAKNIGVTAWTSDPDYVPREIESHEAQAQIACASHFFANSPTSFSLRGTIDAGSDEIPWLGDVRLTSEAKTLGFQTLINDSDPRNAISNWDAGVEALMPGSQALAAALDAVGTYRVANPKADPYEPKNVDEALKGYLRENPTVTPVKSSDGKIRHLQVAPYEGQLAICLSIVKYDSKAMGVDDPGFGYQPTYVEGTSFSQNEQFAQEIVGDCPAS
jgi:hypothetical protein